MLAQRIILGNPGQQLPTGLLMNSDSAANAESSDAAQPPALFTAYRPAFLAMESAIQP
jgi:hypothetical protein